MQNKKQPIIEIMNKLNLSTDFIEEYEEFGILPYNKETIKNVSKVIKKILHINNEIEINIYSEDDLFKIDKLYNELYFNNLI